MVNGDRSILVINAGSSSVKYALFDADNLDPLERGAQNLSTTDAPTGIITSVATLVAMLREKGLLNNLSAVCHRLIHGGADIDGPVIIDADMKSLIASRKALAPLHIPAGLQAIDAAQKALPDVPQLGVFDTAFFANIKPESYRYAVPRAWHDDFGVRRYGFHGISHQYCAGRAHEMLDRADVDQRIVICHLGQGSSVSAVLGQTAIASSMGMTPLEGLPMGTRCGAIDPAVILHLLRDRSLTVEQIDHALHHQSGLLGLSGLSGDYREIEQAALDGNADCQLAIDVLTHRIIAAVGSLVATLGGLDGLVFTGGIGENSASLRRGVCANLGFMGVELDHDRNDKCEPDADIASPDSPSRILVIHTREDLMIARQCCELIVNSA
jgi:acetate kinase